MLTTTTQLVLVHFLTLRVGKNFDTDDLPIGVIVGSSFACGIAVALLWLWPLGPIAKKRIASGEVVLAPGASTKAPGKDTDTDVASGHPVALEEGSDDKVKPEGEGNNEDEETDQATPKTTQQVADKEVDGKEVTAEESKADAQEVKSDTRPRLSASLRKLSQSFADNTYNQDLQSQSMAENAKAKEIWENAELYDEDAEMMFTYLQVFTACLNSFAHGGTFVRGRLFV